MTKQEAMKLLYVVKATYVRHFDKATTNDISNLADAWMYALDGWTYEDGTPVDFSNLRFRKNCRGEKPV